MSFDYLKSTVKECACLLDEKIPGWEREVNLADLNMASTEHCVLGQQMVSLKMFFRAIFYTITGENWDEAFARFCKEKNLDQFEESIQGNFQLLPFGTWRGNEQAWGTEILNRRV